MVVNKPGLTSNPLAGLRYIFFYWLPPHSFQGSFFLENQQKPRGNSGFLENNDAERNGESTPRILPIEPGLRRRS